jgi:hypothetical protein
MPLVLDAAEAPTDPAGTERHARARKVKRQYSDGRLVRVASARHQAEAEMISLMLLDEGVASVVRRSSGFDVPDFLAAGPRDIMVAESGAEIARDVLRPAERSRPPARRRAAAVVGAGAGRRHDRRGPRRHGVGHHARGLGLSVAGPARRSR